MTATSPPRSSTATQTANDIAVQRLSASEPVLVDVLPALDAVPGMRRDLILTSGPTMPWTQYGGGQRTAILGAVVYEGLAADTSTAARLLDNGEVTVAGCQDYGCVGSLAGVTSASMPVVIVEDAHSGQRAFCTLFEGETPALMPGRQRRPRTASWRRHRDSRRRS